MVDKGIPLRLVLYSVAILYLVIDLFVIGGPLRRAVFRQNPRSEEVIEAAKALGVVARVYYQPILLSQVDRRVEEELWKEGRSLEGVDPQERLILRRAALNDLIDLHLLRLKVRFNQDVAVAPESEIAEEVAAFRKRFATEDDFQAALQRRGWSEKELLYRLAARLQQENYLEQMIEVEVSEDEARAWFEANKERLGHPERVRARHIFIATLSRDSEEARGPLAEARDQLAAGEAEFSELAARLSEDARTKGRGGELGWMQRDRLPEGFAEPLFTLAENRPHLVKTSLGWHLLEVLERRPARPRAFGEARAEVVAALEAIKRTEGLKLYRKNLRARDKHKVEVFLDVLKRGLELPVER